MQTTIHPTLVQEPLVQEADEILRKCVHCGFCTATCPTYQLLGDELDGPRGRIYLIKNLLEDNTIDEASVVHLDRCLTCRACETTCPSGVEYGRLADIGRHYTKQHVVRPWRQRLLSAGLRWLIPKRRLFGSLLRLGQTVRKLLPAVIRQHVPIRQPVRHPVISGAGDQGSVLLLTGCVQSSATPNVVASLSTLLVRQGYSPEVINEGCCGALDYHLSAQEEGMARMRRVIDLLYPRLGEVEAIISSASGCGVTLREYPDILKHDVEYRQRAQQVADKVIDPVEMITAIPAVTSGGKVAVHNPCSLQHGIKLIGRVEALLTESGFDLVPANNGHLCCGSAGSYSIMQPALSGQLREQKLQDLNAAAPDVIVTANIGCQMHLQDDNGTPVMHWLELLADQAPAAEG